MKKYQDTDYALNKFSKGIVYKFTDNIIEITLSDYLSENPEKTAEDFYKFKAISDEIYLKQAQDEDTKTRRNIPLKQVEDALICERPTPEQEVLTALNECEEDIRKNKLLEIAKLSLQSLTIIQRRRYLMYHVYNLNMRQIVDIEGVGISKIHKSINTAKNKINEFISKTQK